jgi:hypothetical protein
MVDRRAATLTYGGRSVQLERGVMTALAAHLADQFPGGLATGELVWLVYKGAREPDHAANGIGVTFYRMRALLTEFPLTVPKAVGRAEHRYAFVPRAGKEKAGDPKAAGPEDVEARAVRYADW